MLAVDEESQLRRGPAGETAADDVAYHVMIRQLAISNHGFAVLMAYSLHFLRGRRLRQNTVITVRLWQFKGSPNEQAECTHPLSLPRRSYVGLCGIWHPLTAGA